MFLSVDQQLSSGSFTYDGVLLVVSDVSTMLRRGSLITWNSLSPSEAIVVIVEAKGRIPNASEPASAPTLIFLLFSCDYPYS